MKPKIIINLKNVKKNYQTESETLEILKGVNLSIERNDMVSIMGPSGSGKSTLLNILGLLDKFEEGTYNLSKFDVSQLDSKQMQEIRLKKIGFIFQTFNLIQTLTVRQNIELPMALIHKTELEQNKKSKELLKQVNLLEKADKFPKQLSIGEQQRIAVARALVNDPSIILCDEPTGNLDADTSKVILDYLVSLQKENNATILIVSHNPDIEKLCNKQFILKNGIINQK